MRNFLGLLVINPDQIVLASSRKSSSIRVVVQSHNVVSFLKMMPYLFTSFGSELVEMAIGIGNQKYGGRTTIKLIDRSPPKSIDRPVLPNTRIDLRYFIICAQIEHSHKSIRISTSCHRVLLIELSHHQLRLLRYDRLHKYFVLEWYFLDNSA